MILTENKINLMRHAVSSPGRNWFSTTFGTKDSVDFEELVEHRYATKKEAPKGSGEDVIYSLTEKGKAVLNIK